MKTQRTLQALIIFAACLVGLTLTYIVWDAVLTHFDVGPEQLPRRGVGMGEAADLLERNELDAAFMLGAMRTPAVDRLLRRADMKLLSLGDPGQIGSDLEGLRIDAPFFRTTTVPRRAYGAQPSVAIGTISVQSQLVARATLPNDLVADITRAIFRHKVELAAHSEVLATLSEQMDLSTSQYPLHPGAEEYFRRDEPTFVTRYADTLSLFLTIAVGIGSAFAAVIGVIKQRRRSRVESRYSDAQSLAKEARAAQTLEAMQAVEQRLIEMREQALTDLANERLDANEAFVILQDYLTAQIRELRARLDQHARTAA